MFMGSGDRLYSSWDLVRGWEGFECELRRKHECNAKIQVLGDNHHGREPEHPHPPNYGRVNAVQVSAAVKRRALDTEEGPQQILLQTIPLSTEEGRAALPRLDDMRRNIRRHRQNHPNALPVPRTVEELEIPNDEALSLAGERFLLHDSGREDPHRFIIFATDRNLRLLDNSANWFADGTFQVVPSIFFQLWTVHAVHEGRVVPLVYALLPNKTEETYSRVLRALLEHGDFHPRTVLIDFELAAKNAFERVFPDTAVKGCLFHLSQRIHDKIKQEGLRPLYLADNEFRVQARMIAAIAFVPLADVERAFGALSEIAPPELRPVLNYFEDTYVGRPQIRGNERAPPRFPQLMWNVHEATLEGSSRTNNHVEGWHRRFQVGVGADHQTFWKFLEKVKQEQSLQEMTIVQAQAGAPAPARRREYEQINRRLVRLVEGYANRDILEFLRGVSYNLH
ncbi:uncharacterized protein [Diadema setosum]|uniref:uncharacterized protein n=1 Tax=Diadema setosum TaxID=31175 RepID=UPI003B3BC0AE